MMRNPTASRVAAALTMLIAIGVTAPACLAAEAPGPASRKSDLTSRSPHLFDVPRPRHGGHGALSVAEAGSPVSAGDKRQSEEQARRLARLCADWSKRRLIRFFERATAANVDQCLKMGASVTIGDRDGRTPLHVAARITADPDVISRLVEAGADVMARTKDWLKDTPLHFAARYNPSVSVVARLIDLGADVNARNEERWQPLHRAGRHNRNPEVAALLIERGAHTTSTVKYRGLFFTVWASFWDLAEANPPMRDSAWFRETNARRLAELEEERRRQQRLLAERERERERRAEDARNRQRQRLAEKAAGIARERGSCTPALEAVGAIGAWRKRSPVIAALDDDDAAPLDAYAGAIPFLLAGAGKHAEVEKAFAARVLRDVERWVAAGIRRESETLTTWTGVSRLLRESCLHDIADFIVVSVASGAARDLGAIVFWETSGGLPLVQPEAMRALDHVPQGILAEVSETGRVNQVPRIFEAAARAAGEPFVTDCVDHFNAQSELREGRSLTPVQRAAVTGMCTCFQVGADAKGYLSDKPTYGTVMAELADPENVFSPAHADIKMIFGRCAALHGQSLK